MSEQVKFVGTFQGSDRPWGPDNPDGESSYCGSVIWAVDTDGRLYNMAYARGRDMRPVWLRIDCPVVDLGFSKRKVSDEAMALLREVFWMRADQEPGAKLAWCGSEVHRRALALFARHDNGEEKAEEKP